MMSSKPLPSPSAASSTQSAQAAMAAQPLLRHPRMNSAQLLQHGPELEIEHHGWIYRLRRTAAGKLILTK